MSCSRCGYALTPQNQVCPRCGQPVGQPPRSAPARLPVPGSAVPADARQLPTARQLPAARRTRPRAHKPAASGYPPPGYPPPSGYPPQNPYPPQGGYGAPPGYGSPGYYAPRYATNVSGSLILVFGILSIVLCFFCPIFGVFGVAALLMGNNAVAAIDRGEADPAQRGPANAGRICGIIGTALLALSLLAVIVAVASPQFRKGFTEGFDKSYSQSQHGTTPRRDAK